MYRSLRAVHLLTHYRHCQEGTMKQIDGVKEKNKGEFYSSKGRSTWKEHVRLYK